MSSAPSWVWTKILPLGPIIYPLIKHCVGNREMIFLWFDNWHPLGSLWAKFGDRIIDDSTLGMESKVKDIVDNTSWKWPTTSSWALKELIESTPSTLHPNNGPNSVRWLPSSNGKFSITFTWNYLRKSGDRMPWAAILKGPHNIPKASFVTWMAILGRLNTGNRLRLFGISQYAECVFCKDSRENHNHLFFDFLFSSKIWTCIQSKLNVSWPILQWPGVTQLVALSAKGKYIRAIIVKLAFTCTVYQLWIARNNRIFRKEMIPEEVVIKWIVDMIRFRMMSITNITRHSSDNWFLNSWRLPHTILKTTQPLSDGSSVHVG